MTPTKNFVEVFVKQLSPFFKEVLEISMQLGKMRYLQKIKDALDNYEKGNFIVAALGEFKRGKSSLLNALISKKIFPVGVLPLTSVITIAQYGEKEEAFIYFDDGTFRQIDLSELKEYVTEKGNSGNKLNVRVALIKAPIELLFNGIKLVDTPGVGSIIEKNSEVTKRFVPEIDVALIVSGFEPPITADELKLIKEAEKEISNKIIILNKKDLLDEKQREEIEKFTLKTLEENNIKNYKLYSVSANPKNETNIDTKIDEVRNALLELVRSSSNTIVEESAKRTLLKTISELIQFSETEIFSLKEPSFSLENKINEFQKEISAIDLWIIAARVKTLEAFKINPKELEEIKNDLQYKALEKIRKIEKIETPKRRLRREITEFAKKIAYSICKDFNEKVQNLISGIKEKREGFLRKEFKEIENRIKKAGAEIFGVNISDFEMEFYNKTYNPEAFEFVEKTQALDFSEFVLPILDLFLSSSFILEREIKRAEELLKNWLRENFGRITESFIEDLDEMTRNQTLFFENKLKEIAAEIQFAIDEGKRKKAEGELAVASEIKKIEEIKQKLSKIKDAIY